VADTWAAVRLDPDSAIPNDRAAADLAFVDEGAQAQICDWLAPDAGICRAEMLRCGKPLP